MARSLAQSFSQRDVRDGVCLDQRRFPLQEFLIPKMITRARLLK